jgi:predicted HicB family RNase H-like nuclease
LYPAAGLFNKRGFYAFFDILATKNSCFLFLNLIYDAMSNKNYLHYKDYVGNIEFSEADGVFHGKVVGIKSLISFEGNSVNAITKDFHNAINEYLGFCAETGKQPEKPFKGSFNVRIGTDLHRKATLTASARGISLNTLVENAIRQTVSP